MTVISKAGELEAPTNIYQITEILLGYVKLTKAHVTQLIALLAQSPPITFLDIRCCALRKDDFCAIIDAVVQYCHATVKIIDFGDNNGIGNDGFAHFCSVMSKLKLKQYHFWGIGITNEAVDVFYKAIAALPKETASRVSYLGIRGNKLAGSMAQLTSAIVLLKNIGEMDLAATGFSYDEMTTNLPVIASKLRRMETEYLYIGGNGYDDKIEQLYALFQKNQPKSHRPDASPSHETAAKGSPAKTKSGACIIL